MKTIVIFGSTTGNTEEISNYVVAGLKASGHEVTHKNVADTTVQELPNYELIILGSSTWNEGDIQDDFIPFFDQMGTVSLAGKKAAVFGCGDTIYGEHFCQAVNKIEAKLKEVGAEIVSPSFKIDGDISPFLQKAQEWATSIK
jgi:flavodoxin I